MDNRYSIFKKEKCPVCHGLRLIESVNPEKRKIKKVLCDHCDGKGYLKILKHDYDY